MKTIVGLFDHFSEAEAVVRDLERAGYDRGTISIVASEQVRSTVRTTTNDVSAAEGAGTGAVVGGVTGGMAGLIASLAGLAIPGVGPVLLAGPLVAALTGAGVGAVAGGLIGALTTAGVPEEHARYYEEGVRRGGTLVTVSASDADADRVMDIMNRHSPVDIEERAAAWRRSGPASTAVRPATPHASAAAASTARRNLEGKQAIPVVEEELQVGKRQVECGGIRVYSSMQERPVEEQVNLREERVRVERRPADRPADVGDIGRAFKEGTIEVTERVEEPVVRKNARVVEEVVVGKEATERTETVRDSVRKTDVQVEQVGAAGAAPAGEFDRLESDFRTNFQQSFPGNEYSFDQVKPVYRYGHTLAAEHRGQDWNSFENDARRKWEERNPGTWDKFKSAARYAWERTKDKVS
jgi:uncharacterized protein (TIGR02271 family)